MIDQVEWLARRIWQAVEQKIDDEAEDEIFDNEGWQTLMIESEREEYRSIARELIARMAADEVGQ